MGVTGATGTLSTGLPQLLKRIKQYSGNVPTAVGFGVSTREHFLSVASIADGVVIGSQIITTLTKAAPGERARAAEEYCAGVCGRRNSPVQTNGAHTNGAHTNGSHTNGVYKNGITNGAHTNGVQKNGVAHGDHTNGIQKNGVDTNGTHANGAYTNGAHTNGVYKNGITNGAHTNGVQKNGVHTNGTHTNGTHTNGSHTNGVYKNGVTNGSHTNGVEKIGVDTNGTHANGAHTNGSHTNGVYKNGSHPGLVDPKEESISFEGDPDLFPARFGEFGGSYSPESLTTCLAELEAGFEKIRNDPEFWAELRSYYPYLGRPGHLHIAERLTEHVGGATIWLKREDLNHTGSHKINSALGQILLARRLGKTEIIAQTGAGMHGVATATVCAKFNMKCTIFMGAVSIPIWKHVASISLTAR